MMIMNEINIKNYERKNYFISSFFLLPTGHFS